MKKIIIAIDGVSSTGKSTLARMLSQYLQYKHINTGAMYRAVTLNALKNNWIDDSIGEKSIQSDLIIDSVNTLNFDFLYNGNIYELFLNGENIDTQIKTPLISKYVSIVSSYSLLRKKIVSLQQELGLEKGIVMEGRDIGSVVFPEADLKLFITASVTVRAERRHQELLQMGINSKFNDVLENLQMRDFFDSNRKASPLKKTIDAVLIDNTSLNIEQQFDIVVELLKEKFPFI